MAAPRIRRETFEQIEERGRGEFLAELAEELRTDTYRPSRIAGEKFRRKEAKSASPRSLRCEIAKGHDSVGSLARVVAAL